MTRARRRDAAEDQFVADVCAIAPECEDTLTHDEVLDLFLEFRRACAMTPLRRLRTKTPFSRPCYNKPHRCPGWAGGGWSSAMVYRCEGGSLSRDSHRRRYWLGAHCPECGLYVLPIAIQLIDPTYLWWRIWHPRRPEWTYWLSPRYIRRRWRNR